jgi:hypothetical protein
VRPDDIICRRAVGGLYASPILLLVVCIITAFRWHDFRGSHLLRRNSLATTQGVIISSRLRPTDARHYEIGYEFAVGGKTYRSDEVTFAHTGSRNPEFARDYVRRYPVGKTVTVFYDPADPGFSVLEPASTEFYLLGFFLPAVLFILCYWIVRTRKCERVSPVA